MTEPQSSGARTPGFGHSRPIPATQSSSLAEALERIVPPDRVLTRPIDRIAFAADASFYKLVPKAVVLAASIEEVRTLFQFSRQARVPMTFRAAGTSLSGQSISDGLLVEVARHFRRVTVEDGGKAFRAQPGVIGATVNAVLRPYGTKMGPDPASIATCTVGGILNNNASGMCCGVAQNAYHTLRSLKLVLPSGTAVDTGDPGSDDLLREKEPRLFAGLLELKRELESNAALAARIRSKYRMKNTMGYSLNAFLDFESPAKILEHVVVGSEGTLAFIAEAVLETVPDLPVKYTGLMLFPDLHAACAAIRPLKDAGAKALEVMDRAALRSVETQPGIPPSIPGLPAGAAGLLAEFQAADPSERAGLEQLAAEATSSLKLLHPARFTHDAAEQALLWKIRSGMFPSVGAVRKSGTTVIIEDVAFPIASLADAAVDLNRLFGKHGYEEGIIFGHARDGNLHFVVTQSFNDQVEIDRYARLMDDVVALVVKKYDGALKAEHGTGRNMAPFVETEWGPEACAVMKRLKALVDPEGLLNPGVILNPDPKAHLADLKTLPTVEPEVDTCIECGFCEPKCPSRELTLTPRQRIVLRREMTRLEKSRTDPALLAALEATYPYSALDTCAVDGLCATACPVGIDTGQLTKRLRKERHLPLGHSVASFAARHFGAVEPAVRTALRLGAAAQAVVGAGMLNAISRLGRVILRRPTSIWIAPMPRAARANLPATRKNGAAAVYFTTCVSRTMGHLPGEPSEISLAEAFVAVAGRAGAPLWIPPDVAGHCCGVPFSSKGYPEAHATAVNRTIEAFWRWSDEGRLPVVLDTSPCTYGLKTCRPALISENAERWEKLRIVDGVEFTAETFLPKLEPRREKGEVVLHPVCSIQKMGLSPALEKIARACSEEVYVPPSAGCCAFAGDRGWLFPELTGSATKHEAAEARGRTAAGYYSSSRTCEIGMTRATGEVYRSFIYLLERASRT